MKNQYFGDVNDYVKYGLLRTIIKTTEWRIFVAWYLTPDDNRTDGNRLEYLSKRNFYRKFDPHLFDFLTSTISSKKERTVDVIECSNMLPNAVYHSTLTPDRNEDRTVWFSELREVFDGQDLAFLDPDNGLEIKSIPVGRKNSSKYVSLEEVRKFWSFQSSLLIYQHFPRRPREVFIAETRNRIQKLVNGATIITYRSTNVLFLLVLQSKHEQFADMIRNKIKIQWQEKLVEC